MTLISMFQKKKTTAKVEKQEVKRIIFDIAHGETMDITAPEFQDFKEFLKSNNYEVWQLNQSPLNEEMVKDYTILFIGAPKSAKFDEEEVVAIMKYLKDGGAIVLVENAGGDQHNGTNLNTIASHLGFQFNADYLYHEIDFENDDGYQTISKGVALDPLTMGINSVFSGACCTIQIKDESAAKSLIFSHEPWELGRRNIAVYGYYGLGRFFATSVPLFQYIKSHDNAFLIQSILYWLGELRSADTMF